MLFQIGVEEARDTLLGQILPLPVKTVPLSQALNRIAATDYAATADLPPCPQSAVDGYAIHQKNLKERPGLALLEILFPGDVPSMPLEPGKTSGVVTGGPLPLDTAAVVPLEKVRLEGDYVFCDGEIAPGVNIKPRGEDFCGGQPLIKRGSPVTPGMTGILAAFGHSKIAVYRRPRVAIVCLGPEIVPCHLTPEKGQVRDSNGPLLAALINLDGGLAVSMEYLHGKKPDGLREVLAGLISRADLVLTVGGAASGASDQALALLRETGARMLFWGIRVKPGSHSGGGISGSTTIISLSGNPSACITGYHLLATPALRAMQGLNPLPGVFTATCLSPYDKGGDTRRFLRGYAQCDAGGWTVRILPGQKSSMLNSLGSYNALIEIPSGHPPVREGDKVTVYPANICSCRPELDSIRQN
ncbi:molybdopterin biosynthesis protein MoeA [Desulfocucumis palustris]|uniref:Molybdopterin molybdenumtransferase n=1 Tax=Desulfocucumis palustris TaxID=1898651 RepID=A0A2L2XHM2_9FIRM|nr:molybdopterin molybdotransferase MoeA [Desulfocucumis palustris]GBF35203.1 molybdopterin biosynthesis protein MoeA [Desulfocucumis palustris]